MKVNAVYHPSFGQYQGNPLIEALPPVREFSEVKNALKSTITINPSEKHESGVVRGHLIAQLMNNFFQPIARHIQLEQKLSIMLREGYVGRNLANGSLNSHLQNGYERMMTGDVNAIRFEAAKSTARSMCFIGCSGSGKTTTLNRILATYPQVIFHEKYNFTQIVYLKIDCPHDGSLKSLCLHFFRAIDQALGSDYERKYALKRHGIETLLNLMRQIANLHAIGLLIIDEIQHLSTKKSGGAELILNFFVTLVNVASIPIIMVGTPKASAILEDDLRSARRSAGFGSLLWEPMRNEAPVYNSEFPDQVITSEWYAFTEKLWQYQWVQQQTELTDELRNTWYYYTQGILDLVVKLFCLVQIHAITIGVEKITSELFKKIYEEQFRPVHDILDALRSGNPSRIARYSDLTIPQIQIEQYVQQQSLKAELKTESQDKKLGPHYSTLMGMLTSLGYPSSQTDLRIKSVLKKYPNENVQTLLQYLLEELSSTTTEDPSVKNKNSDSIAKPRKSRKIMKQSEWINTEDTDLRNFFSKAQDQEVDVYELLKSSHYLFNPANPILH